MNFTPQDIAYFLATVQAGNLGRAAQAVGITQSALSKAIRRLEQTVGVALFERGAHGARLTADGQLFLESARQFDLQHSALIRAANDLRAHRTGLLRLGLTNAASETLVVRALSTMIRQRPGLRVALMVARSDALAEALERGALDLAVTPSYEGASFHCEQLVLMQDPIVVAARHDHPLFQQRDVSPNDTQTFSWVLPNRQNAYRLRLSNRLENLTLPPPTVTVEADYRSDVAMRLVENTDLLTAAPRSVLRSWQGRIHPLPLTELEIQRNIVLLSRTDAAWSPLMQTFRHLITQATT